MKTPQLIFLIGTLFFSFSGKAQVSTKEKKKLNAILGNDFVKLPNESSYLKYFECESCSHDSSLWRIDLSDGTFYNNEFVLYQNSISFKANREVLKWMNPSFVTVNEYNAFEDWVRDSMARDMLIYNIESDDRASNYLDYKDRLIYDEGKLEYLEFDPSDREHNRIYFNLNWKQNLDYNDLTLIPILAGHYVTQSQRFNKIRLFDKRGYSYRYNDYYDSFKNAPLDSVRAYFPLARPPYRYDEMLQTSAHLIRSEFLTAKESEHFRDENWILAFFENTVFKDFPVNGLRGFQADAFCHWKSKQIQSDINRKNLPYEVRVTLPTKQDIHTSGETTSPVFTVPRKDYTDNWRITIEEFAEFMKSVKDSVIREHLFASIENYDKAGKFIDNYKFYFDENRLEFLSIEQAARNDIRQYCSLNYKSRINPKDPEIANALKKLESKENYIYRYETMDLKARSQNGKFINFEEQKVPVKDHHLYNTKLWVLVVENNIGKDRLLGVANRFLKGTVTRSHVNIARFIDYRAINVELRLNFDQNENGALVKGLSYEQAIAFYTWKYPLKSLQLETDWQNYILPSKEQFESVQKGSRLVIEQHSISYPMPSFRYVVHFFPKK